MTLVSEDVVCRSGGDLKAHVHTGDAPCEEGKYRVQDDRLTIRRKASGSSPPGRDATRRESHTHQRLPSSAAARSALTRSSSPARGPRKVYTLLRAGHAMTTQCQFPAHTPLPPNLGSTRLLAECGLG